MIASLHDETIARRVAAARDLGVARGLREAALEIGGRAALELLREDRQSLYDTEVNPFSGTVDREEARARLAQYEWAMEHLARALGPLARQVEAAEQNYRDACKAAAAEGRS